MTDSCESCSEHKSILKQLKAGEKVMDRHEQFMTEQTKMSFRILVGVILTLIASIVGMGIAITNRPGSKQIQAEVVNRTIELEPSIFYFTSKSGPSINKEFQ